jgi:hypothetical protein
MGCLLTAPILVTKLQIFADGEGAKRLKKVSREAAAHQEGQTVTKEDHASAHLKVKTYLFSLIHL